MSSNEVASASVEEACEEKAGFNYHYVSSFKAFFKYEASVAEVKYWPSEAEVLCSIYGHNMFSLHPRFNSKL